MKDILANVTTWVIITAIAVLVGAIIDVQFLKADVRRAVGVRLVVCKIAIDHFKDRKDDLNEVMIYCTR